MLYLEIIVAWGAALLSLAVCLYNIFKKLRTAANITLSLASLASACLFSLMGINLLDPGIIPADMMHRLILSLLLLVATLFMVFFFVYPYMRKNRLVLALAASIPGYALCVATIATDLILAQSPDGQSANILADWYPVYIVVITGYCIISLLLIVVKAGRLENRAQKNDLIYLVISLGFIFSAFLALSLYVPYFLGINQLSTLGIIITYTLVLIILNYAAIDITAKDLRVFFATAFYWLLLLALLAVPVMLVLKFNTAEYIEEPVPPPGDRDFSLRLPLHGIQVPEPAN